jgi:hypothetical protein
MDDDMVVRDSRLLGLFDEVLHSPWGTVRLVELVGRGQQPDAFGTERGRLGQRRDRATDLHPQLVVPGGQDRLDQLLCLRWRELVVVLVQRHLGVGGLTVRGDLAGALSRERADNAYHVWEVR